MFKKFLVNSLVEAFPPKSRVKLLFSERVLITALSMKLDAVFSFLNFFFLQSNLRAFP